MNLGAVCLLHLVLTYGSPKRNQYRGTEAPGERRDGRQVVGGDAWQDMGIKMLTMSVPGSPGIDYPILSRVPRTGFSCSGRIPDRFYADPEAGCQVHHKCSGGAAGRVFLRVSALCPNGTLFDEVLQTCDWWYVVDCPPGELALAAAQAQDEVQAQAGGQAQAQGQSGLGGSVSESSESESSFSSSSGSSFGVPSGSSSSSSSSFSSTSFSSGVQNIPVLRPGALAGAGRARTGTRRASQRRTETQAGTGIRGGSGTDDGLTGRGQSNFQSSRKSSSSSSRSFSRSSSSSSSSSSRKSGSSNPSVSKVKELAFANGLLKVKKEKR